MTIDRNGETDPRFMEDEPKDIVLCQCCDEGEAVETLETTQGKKKMCEYCLNFHKQNDTKFLIEQQ